ncbi:MAG: glycosyltransferase [Clostridia bacterium]|nr:glycosyltransferase [Clostridia bacterium]
MRVFQLNTFCGVKSTGRIALEIAKLVREDGGECRIGYGVPELSKDSESYAYRIGTPIQRKVHAAMRKLLDAEGYGSFMATRKLIREMETFQPDLVHFHNLHGCYLHLPSLFAYLGKKDIPVVWTLHDCWPFTGHCAYFDYSRCERWKMECHHCPQQKSYPVCIGLDGSRRNHLNKKKWFTKLKNLTLVAPCEWMLKPLKASFMGLYPAKVILNGVNLDVFRPVDSQLRSQYGLEGKKICLSVAAEWDARKGLKYLIEAAQKMGEDYRFVVIGLDEEQIKTLPDNILGLQRTASTDELAAWYTTADCLVNPTLEDNMPMVNLEALACGTPVGVFETGGCPEAVDDNSGIVVAQGNVDALCDGIETLCATSDKRKSFCLERAQMFDSKKTFQSYLALYKELCK